MPSTFVQGLQASLHLETRTHGLAGNDTNSTSREKTRLSLHDDEFSDKAIAVLSAFSQDTHQLEGLSLCGLPSPQFRRLLESLYTNTPVKVLKLYKFQHADDVLMGVCHLLNHKIDLSVTLVACKLRTFSDC